MEDAACQTDEAAASKNHFAPQCCVPRGAGAAETLASSPQCSQSPRRNLFWCTLLVPSAIIAIGINFILNPVGASTAFGIPIHDPTAFPFMWIKGIRDIFSGLVILAFLLRGDRRTTATLYAIAIFIDRKSAV